jgi:hypothetical protein
LLGEKLRKLHHAGRGLRSQDLPHGTATIAAKSAYRLKHGEVWLFTAISFDALPPSHIEVNVRSRKSFHEAKAHSCLSDSRLSCDENHLALSPKNSLEPILYEGELSFSADKCLG